MRDLITLAAIFWIPIFIVLVKNFLWHTYFWQIKEYRWDRFTNHVLWDEEVNNRNHNLTRAKFIFFALATLLFSLPFLAVIGILAAYIVWLNEMFEFFQRLLAKNLNRPSLKSPRNLLILAISLIITFILVALLLIPFLKLDRSNNIGYVSTILNSENFKFKSININFPDTYFLMAFSALLGLFLDLGSNVIVTFAVWATAPLAWIRRKITMLKAIQKYNKLKGNLIIIGVTGSQGKTTTKEILYELLKDKYKVVKTPENYNTDFGVANTILNGVRESTQIFIAEMGAYRKGEIANICKYFPPNISVITDIDVQHIGIFGSKQKVFEAKSEIIKNMKLGGVSVINGDNEYAERLALMTRGDAYLVFTKESNIQQFRKLNNTSMHLLLASDIKEKAGLEFKVNQDDEQAFKVSIPQKGEHLVHNILIAISVAKIFDISDKSIAAKLKELKTKLPRLSIDTGDNDTLILNDSYNSSPKGFSAAVTILNSIFEGKYEDIKHKKNTGRRIVVTKGIYELGKHKQSIYKDLVKNIRNKVDVLVTTDDLLIKEFKYENTNTIVYKVKDHLEMIFKLREILAPKDIILLEGKLHPEVIKELVSDKF